MASISARVIAAIMAGVEHPGYDGPKAELHLHLEGSIWPETLICIAPELDVGEIRRRFSFNDFAGFLSAYEWITRHLRTPEDYAMATAGLVERLEAENIVYAEVTFSAGIAMWRGLDVGAIFDAILEASIHPRIRLRWIVDAVRQFGPDHVTRVAEFAASRAGRGVVAFSIGGDEARGPASQFAGAYRIARRAGLRLLAHAGETCGPQSVWEALEVGAERIGHGIRSVEDPELVRCLRDRQIPLEICLTSNLATGAVASLASHPLRQLYDAGVPVTLNTDDPALFNTTLFREYRLAERLLGFNHAELGRIRRNAFLFAFDPPGGGGGFASCS